MQRSGLSRRLQESTNQVKQSFRNILPSIIYKRQFTRYTLVSFDYTTLVKEPTIQQLQPVVWRYDPLNLYEGNPGLRPAYIHQGRINLNSVAVASGIFWGGSVTFNYTANPITAAVTINERQVRSTRYVNLKQNHNFSAFLNLGFLVKQYNSRFNLSPYFRQGQSVNLLNGVAGTISQRSVGGNLSFTHHYKKYLDVNLRANITLTSSKYELNKNQNQVFVTSVYMGDATMHFLKKFNLMLELDYRKFENTRTSFSQDIPILDILVMIGNTIQGEGNYQPAINLDGLGYRVLFN